jgi:hypothetical protein
MKLFQSYGPNSGQVKRFIERLKTLSSDDWEQVVDANAVTRAAYGYLNWLEIEAAHKTQYGEVRWLDDATKPLRSMNLSISADQHSIAHVAIIALADCEVLTALQFAVMYSPFANVVPVSSIGPGKAPQVEALPTTLHGRFIARTKMLSGPEWSQVTETWAMLDSALGEGVYDAAAEAAQSALMNAAESGTIGEDAVSEAAVIFAPEYSPGWLEDHRDIVRGIGAFVKRPDWASATVERYENEAIFEKGLARNALAALAVPNAISPQHLAVLYTPFAGPIPLKSLQIEGPPRP